MNRYKNKKILVLGGAFYHCKVVEAIHDLGALAYVADYLAVSDSPAKQIADKDFLIDIKDIDRLVALCVQEGIDGVVATSVDPAQLPYQKLCERMGYPCFGNKEQFFTFTNKSAFKDCCKKHGVDTIPEYTIEDTENGRNVEYPLFVKPVDSRGSRGQTIVQNKSDLYQAIEVAKSESSNGKVVIEKYMDGYQDITLCYLMVNGKATLIRIADRYLGTKESNLSNLAIAVSNPSKYADSYMESTHKKVIKMLGNCGLKNTPVFLQGFMDGNRVRFYDPGLRFPGGEYEALFKKVNGLDLSSLMVQFSITGKIDEISHNNDLHKLGGNRFLYLFPTLKPGRIGEISGMERIVENPSVISYLIEKKVGDIVQDVGNGSRIAVRFYLLSSFLEDEIKTVKFIQETLKINDEEGNSMLCDIFEVSGLR